MDNEPTKLEKTVIDNIRRIRQEKGISQLRLSIFCGTSASYIGLMETYKNIPKLSTIERIAEALDVPVLEIFSSSEKTNTLSNSVEEKELERKERIRNHIKKEIINRISSNLDDILQKHNDELENVTKIYKAIADAVAPAKPNDNEVVLRLAR